MSPISRKPIAPAKQNAQQDKAEAQAQARQAQDKAEAQAQARQAQDQAKAQAQAARPRTGVSGPYMPTVGGTPRLSPADKARMAVEAAKKATANTPKPGMGTPEVARPNPAPVVPNPQSDAAAKAIIAAKTAAPTAPQAPTPGMGRNPTATEMAPGNGPSPANPANPNMAAPGMKRGGAVRSKPQTKFASGGSVGGASRRGDGIAQRGKTKGRMC